MNKIAQAFAKGPALIPFITGSDPDIKTTEKLILAMTKAGADLIEIGIPFSDPAAEGPIIQAASERALAGGCTVNQLFDMVKRVRSQVTIPLLFMTYINPIFVYGKERFMENCVTCGIDGLIVPDLPFEERGEIADVCKKHGITQISMIAPTSDARIREIAKEAEGFLYCVSSLGVTGVRANIQTDVGGMIQKVREVSNIPCAVGFGISTSEQARNMAAVSNGVIIGSAIVRLIGKFGRDSVVPVTEFLANIKKEL